MSLELRALLGKSRHPTAADQGDLPYLSATLMEVQRMATALPLAVPHCAAADIEIKGYQIPKDSQVRDCLLTFFKCILGIV